MIKFCENHSGFTGTTLFHILMNFLNCRLFPLYIVDYLRCRSLKNVPHHAKIDDVYASHPDRSIALVRHIPPTLEMLFVFSIYQTSYYFTPFENQEWIYICDRKIIHVNVFSWTTIQNAYIYNQYYLVYHKKCLCLY